MQVYFEEDYDYIDNNILIKELMFLIKSKKDIYNFLIKKNINNICDKSVYLMTISDFYQSGYVYKLFNKINLLYEDFENNQKKIISKLIIKKNLRKYIFERLYRYPDGLRLNTIKENFYNNIKKI